jgi:hypothetical protein
VISTFATILALAQLIGAVPTPSPTPPKTIVRVRSSLLCTTLRDNIFHGVEGLRRNDSLITQGQVLLAQLAYDSIAGPQRPVPAGVGRRAGGIQASSAVEMDNFELSQLVHALAENLDRVNALLSNPARSTDKPSADDQGMLATAKNSLQAVADRQKISLNILSGTLDTSALQLLLSKGDGTQGALGPVSYPDQTFNLENATMGSSSAQANPTSSGSTGSNAPSSTTPTSATSSGTPTETSLFANNNFGRLALAELLQEKITGASENGVLPAILPIINACRS